MVSPKISVIIPAYNVEQYIRQTIDSVVSQNIGFLENIELIIVDDGSDDRTSSIALDIKANYPNNVLYFRQKNRGVSAARNLGLTKARGEYVHFFDSDDLISNNYYKKSIKFIEKFKDQVDFVASKIMFFDTIIDSHPLNYKFKRTGIINLSETPNSPILHVSSCVFKKSAVQDLIFDEQLKITEDAKFISQVLLKKRAYGVLKNTKLYYRKRTDKNSAIDRKLLSKDFYLETPKKAYLAMASDWTDESGCIEKYMQYTLLYDISYRLDQNHQEVLSKSEEKEYILLIENLIKRFDDEVIIKASSLNIHKKIYALKVKHGEDFETHTRIKGDSYFFNNQQILNIVNTPIHLDFISISNQGVVEIEGYLNIENIISKNKIILRIQGKDYPVYFVERSQREASFLGNQIYSGGGFKVRANINVRSSSKIEIGVLNGGYFSSFKIFETGIFTGLSDLSGSYKKYGRILIQRRSGQLILHPYSYLRHAIYETVFMGRIIFDWKIKTALGQFIKLLNRNIVQLSFKKRAFELLKPLFITLESVVMIPRAIILRLLYFVNLAFKKRPIWLVSDRALAAGDNGEAFFKYVQTLNSKNETSVYFVISKKSPDFNRIRSIGKVLDQRSLKYKLLFLLSDIVISSHADIETTNPFMRQVNQFSNLFNFNFVFLQHGIIRDDLSGWLNRYEKNIKLFITSGEVEKESVLTSPYYYSSNVVVLTGMPRYDNLKNEPANKLILAPTYRKKLASMKTDSSGKRRYDPHFKNSDYYMFYEKFINDSRIKDILQKKNMLGELYLHPTHEAQIKDFNGNENFHIMKYPYDYQKAFAEGELLISDYSSLVFDFAYLKKPVIYAQFDANDFRDDHNFDGKSYFIDQRDGFGKIFSDYETLVQGVIETIQNNCTIDPIYSKRVDAFFYKIDTHNSRRVYEAILNLDTLE